MVRLIGSKSRVPKSPFSSQRPHGCGSIRSHLQEFKDLTGIDIDYLVVAENEYWNKLTIDLTSGAGQFNVFMSGPTLNWATQQPSRSNPWIHS